MTTQIVTKHFKQYASFKVFPSCKVIWEEFESMEPEEVDKAPLAANSASCVLDQCPSWLIKVLLLPPGPVPDSVENGKAIQLQTPYFLG